MIASADVVVIGFGVSPAYHLARHGIRVTVLERPTLASQTSPRAAGLTSQVRSADQVLEQCESPDAAEIDERAGIGDDDHRDSSVATSFRRSSTE